MVDLSIVMVAFTRGYSVGNRHSPSCSPPVPTICQGEGHDRPDVGSQTWPSGCCQAVAVAWPEDPHHNMQKTVANPIIIIL